MDALKINPHVIDFLCLRVSVTPHLADKSQGENQPLMTIRKLKAKGSR